VANRKRRRPAAARTTTAPRAAAAPPEPEVVPAGRGRAARNTDPDSEPTWNRTGLLVLLALVFVLEVAIGAVSHAIGHRQRLLIVDLFFWQAPFVLPACVILMPAAKYLTHQPRTLRFLESLSLGAVFALLSLLLITVFVHPALPGSLNTDQYIDRLQAGDAVGIVLADVLAMLGSAQLFPGIQRMLSAPGRRARRRMVQRNAAAAGPRSSAARRPKGASKPKR
jgi:hypothetical protein